MLRGEAILSTQDKKHSNELRSRLTGALRSPREPSKDRNRVEHRSNSLSFVRSAAGDVPARATTSSRSIDEFDPLVPLVPSIGSRSLVSHGEKRGLSHEQWP